MPKNKEYWKEYNQKRKEYNRLKQQEYRTRLKVVDKVDEKNLVVDNSNQETKMSATEQESLKVVDTQKEKVVDVDKVADKKSNMSATEKNNSTENNSVSNQEPELNVSNPTPKEKVVDKNPQITYNPDGTIKSKTWAFKNIDKMIEWIESW